MSIAIFPGSFDPITNGHLDVARQAGQMFDQVYLVIMTNTRKHYLFSAEERKDFAADAVKDLPNVKVIARPTSLTVAVAHELGARTIIRGVRNTSDFIYEQQIAGMNEKLADDVHSALIFTRPENAFIASSMIKEIAKFQGPIERFLPAKAAKALAERLHHEHQA